MHMICAKWSSNCNSTNKRLALRGYLVFRSLAFCHNALIMDNTTLPGSLMRNICFSRGLWWNHLVFSMCRWTTVMSMISKVRDIPCIPAMIGNAYGMHALHKRNRGWQRLSGWTSEVQMTRVRQFLLPWGKFVSSESTTSYYRIGFCIYRMPQVTIVAPFTARATSTVV